MNRLVTLILLLAGPLSVFSQTGITTDIGVAGVGAYYIGDLNPYAHFKGIQPGGGILMRNNFDQRFSLKTSLIFTRVQGSDSWSDNGYQNNRNIEFRSPITEFSSVLEFNFFNYSPANPSGSNQSNAPKAKKNFSPYMFGGIGYFQMNPQTKVNGEWVELQSLGTEGQSASTGDTQRQYNRGQIAFPFGMGAKFKISKGITLSLEWGMRKTFTDYIDDVSGRYANPAELADANGNLSSTVANPSLTEPNYDITNTQRGNSKSKDWYNISAIQLTFQLGNTDKCPKVL